MDPPSKRSYDNPVFDLGFEDKEDAGTNNPVSSPGFGDKEDAGTNNPVFSPGFGDNEDAGTNQQPKVVGANGVLVSSKSSLVSSKSSLEKLEEAETQCGIGRFRPKFLQPFASIWGFLVAYTFISLLQGMFFAYFLSVISTIERRFGIKSRTTGFVMSGNEISQILFSIILNHYGGKGHRPRWIAFGMFCCTLSCLVMASPHFFLGSGSQVNQVALDIAAEQKAEGISKLEAANDPLFTSRGSLCNVTKEKCDKDTDDSGAAWGLFLVFFSFFLGGIGTSVYYSLGTSYIDDQVKSSQSSFLLSLSSALRVLGPFLGFGLGFLCLGIYVDPGSDPGISPRDPRWMGAWWLGFILIGAPLFLSAILIAFFPQRLPKKPSKKKKEEVTPTEEEVVTKDTMGFDLDTGPVALPELAQLKETMTRLIKNPIAVCHAFAVVFHLIANVGFFTFTPKFIESQFRRTPAESSMATGVSSVLVQVFGMVIAGYVIKKFKPRARYITGWGCLVSALYIGGILLGMVVGCDQIHVQGDYNADTNELAVATNCSALCNCPQTQISPVCASAPGAVDLHYFSPCHAGCKSVEMRNGTKVFSQCDCVEGPIKEATGGYCESSRCDKFMMYLIILAITKAVSSTGRVGGLLVILRSVKPEDKSVAIGFVLMLLSILAFIPAPIIFGAVIDSTCLIWKDSICTGRGNCTFYDAYDFRIKLHSLCAFFTFIALLLDMVVWRMSNRIVMFPEEGENKTLKQQTGSNQLEMTKKSQTD